MTVKLDTNHLFGIFRVSCFDQLEEEIQLLAPSMAEYYLDDLASYIDESIYINKSSIQKSICIDEYSLYLDYSDCIYLEFTKKEHLYSTQSFW